jgi:Xaa-Pro aminopeptidase
MKAMHVGMKQRNSRVFMNLSTKNTVVSLRLPSIVGAGNNGCILHYIENSKTRVENDLVLMDVGAEYHGYTADVTRTISC